MSRNKNVNEGLVRAVFVLPSLARAGAETQVVNLVNGLDPTRFEKHLFVFEQELDQLDRIDRNQLQFHHHPRRHKFDIDPAVQLARLIDARQIDVVHCSLQISLFIGWLAIRLARHKPRLLLALHTTVNRNRREELFNHIFYQWLMRSCDQIICVCQAQKIHWQAKYPFLHGRIVVIYNGIDPDTFDPRGAAESGAQLREKLGIPASAFVACCIAAFRPEKGHRYLLDAFKQLSTIYPNTYLLLAGDGPLREHMESLAKEKGISERVLFLGVIDDVRPVLMASNVSIIASTTETFSMAMLESLAMGIPMVATDIGGAQEAVLDRATGLLVSPGDPKQLGDALASILPSDERRLTMGIAARKLLVSQFTQERMLSETSKLLSYNISDRTICGSISG